MINCKTKQSEQTKINQTEMMSTSKLFLMLALFLPSLSSAFHNSCIQQKQLPSTTSIISTTKATTRRHAVFFDQQQQKFVTNNPTMEGPGAGYDIWGTLLRAGPKPFVTRIVNPDTYEQAVLKFMAMDKVDRIVAQANMDHFLENAQDWAYYRTQGIKPDYVTIDQQELILRIVWSGLVVAGVFRAIIAYKTGENFWMFLVSS